VQGRRLEHDPRSLAGWSSVLTELGDDAVLLRALDLLSGQLAASSTARAVDAARVLPLPRLAKTIDRWSNEVLAYHSTGGASNGPTEAVNLVVKKILRTATATATSTT
jgi:hypothetical protein